MSLPAFVPHGAFLEILYDWRHPTGGRRGIDNVFGIEPRDNAHSGIGAYLSGGTRFAQLLGITLGLGVSLGLLSVGSDYVLSYPWSMVGNVAGTWLVVAFVAGAVVAVGPGILGGAVGLGTLVVATLTYYAGTAFLWPPSAIGKLLPGVLVWGAVSLIAGPIIGAAGSVWRRRSETQAKSLPTVAVAVLSAGLVAESVYLLLTSSGMDTTLGALTELGIGALIPIALLRSVKERVRAFTLLGALVGAGIPLIALGLPLIFRLAGSGRL